MSSEANEAPEATEEAMDTFLLPVGEPGLRKGEGVGNGGPSWVLLLLLFAAVVGVCCYRFLILLLMLFLDVVVVRGFIRYFTW